MTSTPRWTLTSITLPGCGVFLLTSRVRQIYWPLVDWVTELLTSICLEHLNLKCKLRVTSSWLLRDSDVVNNFRDSHASWDLEAPFQREVNSSLLRSRFFRMSRNSFPPPPPPQETVTLGGLLRDIPKTAAARGALSL